MPALWQSPRAERQPCGEVSNYQTCAHQERDLRAFAKKAGYKVVGVWKEIASGAKQERAERKKVLALAQARKA